MKKFPRFKKWLRVNSDNVRTFLLISGVIILVVVAPYIFTRHALSDLLDFSNTGQIGDTIGGITSPITGLVGAFLVYLSFRQQLNANKIQREALDSEIQNNQKERRYNAISKDLDTLREEINSYRIADCELTGTNAINHFKEKFIETNKEQTLKLMNDEGFKNFYFLIALVDDIYKRIYAGSLDLEDLITLQRKLTYLYTSKLGIYLIPIIAHFQNMGIVENEIVKAFKSTSEKMRPLIKNYTNL